MKCDKFVFFQHGILKVVGGEEGTAAGVKVLEQLVQYMINPSFLPSISWTGRGKDKGSKIPLCGFPRIVNFIAVSVNKADSTFTNEKTMNKLKYKILKQAPIKFGKLQKTQNNSEKENHIQSSTLRNDSPSPSDFMVENTAVEHIQQQSTVPQFMPKTLQRSQPPMQVYSQFTQPLQVQTQMQIQPTDQQTMTIDSNTLNVLHKLGIFMPHHGT